MAIHVHVSFLRGVNVGGHNKIKMDALRELYRGLGFQDPRTYVQSGNVVFGTKKKELDAKILEDAIAKAFGFRPGVVLRSAAELRETVIRNPFAKREGVNPGLLLVSFLAGTLGKAEIAALNALPAGAEEIHVTGREIFIYFPDGMGRSKFPWASMDKVLKMTVTGRNLRTVTTLLGMAEEMEAGIKYG